MLAAGTAPTNWLTCERLSGVLCDRGTVTAGRVSEVMVRRVMVMLVMMSRLSNSLLGSLSLEVISILMMSHERIGGET
jgi:hypothetical protein